jgi:hypothetical protein
LLIVNSGLFGVDIALAPFVRLLAEGAYRRGADLVDVIWGDPLLDRIRLEEAQAGSLKDYPKWPAAARMEHVETASAYLALRGDDPDLLADIEATVGDLTPIRDLAKPLTRIFPGTQQLVRCPRQQSGLGLEGAPGYALDE